MVDLCFLSARCCKICIRHCDIVPWIWRVFLDLWKWTNALGWFLRSLTLPVYLNGWGCRSVWRTPDEFTSDLLTTRCMVPEDRREHGFNCNRSTQVDRRVYGRITGYRSIAISSWQTILHWRHTDFGYNMNLAIRQGGTIAICVRSMKFINRLGQTFLGTA